MICYLAVRRMRFRSVTIFDISFFLFTKWKYNRSRKYTFSNKYSYKYGFLKNGTWPQNNTLGKVHIHKYAWNTLQNIWVVSNTGWIKKMLLAVLKWDKVIIRFFKKNGFTKLQAQKASLLSWCNGSLNIYEDWWFYLFVYTWCCQLGQLYKIRHKHKHLRCKSHQSHPYSR